MTPEAGKNTQENQGHEFHLTSYRAGPNAPLVQRKGIDVVSFSYQTSTTMVLEEEFDIGKLKKNTYYHNLETGKSVVSPESIDDPIGGQFTSGRARETLAVFDRIDTQVSIGAKLSEKPMGPSGPAFHLYAEEGYGFSVWMLGKNDEVNRIRVINPQVALVESFDMMTEAKTGRFYEIATGRTVPAAEKDIEAVFADKSSPVVGMGRIKDIHAGLMAKQAATEPAMVPAHKAEVTAPLAAARDAKARFAHPENDTAPKSPPGGSGPQAQHGRKKPGPR